MTPAALVPLLPLVLVGLGSVAVLLQVAVRRSAAAATAIAAGALVAALVAVPWARGPAVPLVAIDAEARWYWAVLLGCGLAVSLLVHDVARRHEHPEEAQALVLLATLGGGLLASATHLATVFLGIELLSVALYALLAWVRADGLGVEAAAKYLVLGATASGFLLFGAALVYAATGELGLAAFRATGVVPSAGVVLILVGLGFKLAVVPFHLWAPDVYQGAPAPITALVATVSKAAVVAMVARWTAEAPAPALLGAVAAMAGASMLVGNLLALRQDNVKRMLAYSSIAQVGYLLVAVVAGGASAAGAVAFYVAAYAATSIAAFGAVSLLSGGDRRGDALGAYRGLFWTRPWLAALFAVALLSLAGAPLTGGFLGKLLVVRAGIEGADWALVGLLVVGSVIGVFYYLRVVAAMFQPAEGAPAELSRSVVGWTPVALATVAVVALGIVPGPILALVGR